MDKIKNILITILAILMFGIPIMLGRSSKHILIIYSTSGDSIRAREINSGMDIYLDHNASFSNTVIFDKYYMNMDVPARQKCEIYLTEMKTLQDIIENKKPDVVILSGDIAQKLIGVRMISPPPADTVLKKIASQLAADGNCDKDRQMTSELSQTIASSLKYEPKIVFTGVTNRDVKEYGYNDHPNVTGVYQHLYLPAVKATIEDVYYGIPEDINGKPENLIILDDGSASQTGLDVQQLQTDLSKKNALNAPLKFDGIKTANSWEQWQAAILSANENNALIFIAGYENISEHPARFVLRWTVGCAKFPTVGWSESFVDDGGMLRVSISNLEQGAAAMDLARHILNQQPGAQIPFRKPSQFTIGINQPILNARHIDLPPMYESFSRASNTFAEQITYNIQTDCK